MSITLPQRPDNDSDYGALTKVEKNIVVAAVLLGLTNQEAFLRYNPHFATPVGKPDRNGFGNFRLNDEGATQCGFFWKYPKVREFRADYERTLQSFLNRNLDNTPATAAAPLDTDEIVSVVMRNLRRMVKTGDIDNYDDLKTVVDILAKQGAFKVVEEKQIPPIRVLPARCKSECNYCFFIETAKAKGMMFDSCDYCKARKVAEENGFKFDHKNLLDVPTEVVAKFEGDNNVKLTDILANGQQTREDIEQQLGQ